jgi:Tfp pilus assembly protein FimT
MKARNFLAVVAILATFTAPMGSTWSEEAMLLQSTWSEEATLLQAPAKARLSHSKM